LQQRKETNSNCLASFRVQQGATSISIWLLGKMRERESKMEKKEEDKETSSPVVFSSEILLSFAVYRLKEQNKLLSSCIRYYISIITVDHFPTQQESEMLVILTYSSVRLDLIGDTKSQKSSFPLFFSSSSSPDDPFLSNLDT